jgi:hypothetical protein
VPLRLFLVLSWLDNEEREGQQAKDQQVASRELGRAIDKCASEAVTVGSRLLRPALDAFPSVFHRVITPKLMMPRLEKLEKAEQDTKASLEKMNKDAELLRCSKCRNKVPRSLMHEWDACIVMGHSGMYYGAKWTCCEEIVKDSKGCSLTRGKHVFT